MKNHAGIVSSLIGGDVKLLLILLMRLMLKNFTKEAGKDSVFAYAIKSGVVEFNHNKGIILCE